MLNDIQARDIMVGANLLMKLNNLQFKEQKNYLMQILLMFNHTQVLKQIKLFFWVF